MPDEFHLDVGLLTCFWCGGEMGVAIDRRIKKGPSRMDPPKHYIADYTPCDKCKEMFDKGIHVVGVTETPIMPDQEALGQDETGRPMYPDGTWFMASEEWATRFLADDQEALNSCLEKRRILVPSEFVNAVVSRFKNEEAQVNESDSSGVPPDSGEVPDQED